MFSKRTKFQRKEGPGLGISPAIYRAHNLEAPKKPQKKSPEGSLGRAKPRESGPSKSLSFLSLVVWISLVKFKQGISLFILEFSMYFPRISWVRQEQKILGRFGGFSLIKPKTKERKDRDLIGCAKGIFALAYDPGRHLKECRSLGQEPMPKKCFGKCRSETGCRGKCRKKCSGLRLLYYLHIGTEPGALFSALSPAPRFGPALSEALSRHFSWPRLRHSFRWRPGFFAKGILGGTGFSRLRWEKGSETPSYGRKKGSETPSFLMLRPRERGSLRPFFPPQRGSLRPFFPPQKGKPRTSQNPLSENPLSAMHENWQCKN